MKLKRAYEKGVKAERKVVNNALSHGCIAFRSARSLSPIDVCIINPFHHFIYFIQVKNFEMTTKQKNKLKRKMPADGLWRVRFRVYDKNDLESL